MVSQLAWGISAATNSTPVPMRPEMQMYFAGQTVELGNNERGLLPPTQIDGYQQLRSVGMPLTALDLGELGVWGATEQQTELGCSLR
jgi:hypothetical protein